MKKKEGEWKTGKNKRNKKMRKKRGKIKKQTETEKEGK